MKGNPPGKQRGVLVSTLVSEKGFGDGGSESSLHMQTPRSPVSHWRTALSLAVKVKFMTDGSRAEGLGGLCLSCSSRTIKTAWLDSEGIFAVQRPWDVSAAQGGREHILSTVLGLEDPETNTSHSPLVSCSSGLEGRQTNTTFTLRGEAVRGHKCEFCKLSLDPFFPGSSPLLLQLSVFPVPSPPFLPSILPWRRQWWWARHSLRSSYPDCRP